MEKKNRIEYIDLAKGFCMLLVVLGHVSENVTCITGKCSGLLFVSYCSAFLMPLYFFLSGLFFKANLDGIAFLKKNINRLLIPYLFFYITSWMLSCFLFKFDLSADTTFKGVWSLLAFYTEEPIRNGPIWFLFCLFEVNLIYFGLNKLFRGNMNIIFPVVFFTGLVGSFFYFEKYFNLPMNIDRAMYYLPYFVIGSIVKKHTGFISECSNLKKELCLLVLMFAIYFMFNPVSSVIFSESNIFLFYFLGTLGTLLILQLSKILVKIPIISYIGRYSIVMLCLHALPLPLLSKVLGKYISSGFSLVILEFFVVVFSICLITPICIKYFPYFFAQKDLIKIKS